MSNLTYLELQTCFAKVLNVRVMNTVKHTQSGSVCVLI